MTVNIQKCSNITVLGHHSNSNCKIVYNITTGEFYASVLDTSKILGVTQGAVSFSLNPDYKRTCKGMRLCYLSRIMEYLDEIQEANRKRTEQARVNAEKSAAYDTIMAEQEAKRKAKAKAEERVAAHKAKMEALRRQIEAESAALSEAEIYLDSIGEVL